MLIVMISSKTILAEEFKAKAMQAIEQQSQAAQAAQQATQRKAEADDCFVRS